MLPSNKSEDITSQTTPPTSVKVDIDMDLLKKGKAEDAPEQSDSPPVEGWTDLNDNAGDSGTRMARRLSTDSSASVASSGGSVGSRSASSSGSKRKVTKRRTWKKPKDKPKRPLSAYNIFFKHTRSRIVEGLPEEGTVEETIASIENIVANSTETRRHRKTHGQISFGDLARKIADKWKAIGKNQRALFDHYAALDMKRYRRDVSIWKAKKEQEALAAKGKGTVGLDASGCSSHSSGTYFSDFDRDDHIGANSVSSCDEWNTMQAPRHDALSASFNSVDSEGDFSLEPVPIVDMSLQRMQQLQMQMDGQRCVPSYIESSDHSNQNDSMMMQSGYNNNNNSNWEMNNSNNGANPNNGNMDTNNKKLQDIWVKNRQLEESINQLKKELSATNFSLGNNKGENTNGNSDNTDKICPSPTPSSNANSSSGFLNATFTGGPSIDRMQQLHRRRQLMGDYISSSNINMNLRTANQQIMNQQKALSMNNTSTSTTTNTNNGATPSGMNDPFNSYIDTGYESPTHNEDAPMEGFELSPVPFNEVFYAGGGGDSSKNDPSSKRKEMMSNLGHLTL